MKMKKNLYIDSIRIRIYVLEYAMYIHHDFSYIIIKT